jgi:hypothetical protein
MTPLVKEDLAKEIQSPAMKQLCEDTCDLLRRSRSDMSTYYQRWDQNYSAYKNEISKTQADGKAAERGEPQKLVVPFLFAQVSAFSAFIKSLYSTRKTFFELEALGQEDVKTAPLAEAVLDKDLRQNNWNLKQTQILQDICMCNLGGVHLTWQTKKRMKKTRVPDTEMEIDGIMTVVPGYETEEEETYFEGNDLRTLSPYRFFPDTRYPLSQFTEGEFCGSYDEFTKLKLGQQERDGFFVGTKHIKDIERNSLKGWQPLRLNMFMNQGKLGGAAISGAKKNTPTPSVAVAHISRWITPKDFEINGEPIGPEDYPCLYDMWIANENRMIRLSQNEQAFERFPYFIGQYDPSQHELCPDGLAGKIHELQFLATWYFNSHVASVRKTIQNWLVADPSMVMMEDLVERNPVIRLKQAARAGGIDRAIKQLEVKDFTQNHIGDVAAVKELIEYTTGITENIMGNYNSGRRSAREAQQVFQSAASRLEMVASNLDEQLYRPLGECMLSNSTEFISIETLVRISGLQEEMTPDKLNAMLTGQQGPSYEDVQYFKLAKEDIQGNFDFRFIATISPSARNVLGSILLEIFDRLAASPEAALMSNLNPGKIVREILKLQGVTNLNQFGFDPAELLRNELNQQQPSNGGGGEQGGQPPTQGAPTARAA